MDFLMSSRDAEDSVDAACVRARLEAYYSRYYDGMLRIPGWRDLVAMRLDDVAYERRRLERLELALDRSVAGARLLNVGGGTGGVNELPLGARARALGVGAAAAGAASAAPRAPGPVLFVPAQVVPLPTASVDVIHI